MVSENNEKIYFDQNVIATMGQKYGFLIKKSSKIENIHRVFLPYFLKSDWKSWYFFKLRAEYQKNVSLNS